MSNKIEDVLFSEASFKGAKQLAVVIEKNKSRKWLAGSSAATIQSEISKLLNPLKYPNKNFTPDILEAFNAAFIQKKIQDGLSHSDATEFAERAIRDIQIELNRNSQSGNDINSYFKWVDKTFYLVSIANRSFKLSKNPDSHQPNDLVLLINRAIKYITVDMSSLSEPGKLKEKKIRFNLPDESNCIDQWKALHHLICEFTLTADDNYRFAIISAMKETSILIQQKILTRFKKDPNEYPPYISDFIEQVLDNLKNDFPSKSIKEIVAIYLTQLSRNDNIRIYKHERLPVFEIPIVLFDFDDGNDPSKFGAFLLHFNKRNQFLIEELTDPQKQALNRNFWKRIKNAPTDVKGKSVTPYYNIYDFEIAAKYLKCIP